MNLLHLTLRKVIAASLSLSLVVTSVCQCTATSVVQVPAQPAHRHHDGQRHDHACACGTNNCCCGEACYCGQKPQQDNGRPAPQRPGESVNVLGLACQAVAVLDDAGIEQSRHGAFSEHTPASNYTLVALSIRINC
jgi:hypothetical protein